MIRKAEFSDAKAIAELAAKLWENHSIDEMITEFEDVITSEDGAVFLYYHKEKAIGFAQCQLRHDYVEGTKSSPVGYLEGIFIEPSFRDRGYTKNLLHSCEAWAKEKGCLEFASDCELHNNTSLQFHLNVGFTEANRIICFTKKL